VWWFLLLVSDADKDESASTVTGDGYSYELPDGWSDAGDEALEDNLAGTRTVDLAAALGEGPDDTVAVLMIGSVPARPVPFDLEAARLVWADKLDASEGATPRSVVAPPIGGEGAIGFELRQNVSGLELVQTYYLTVHDGQVYVFSTTENHENETWAKYEKILDSRTWTSRA
jgi:hypothetical protein